MPARRITKVLIANRGEIACRVIRACRELDIAHGRRVLGRRRAPRCTCAWPTRRSRSGRRPRARATCAPRRSSTRSSRRAPTRSTPATASCPRTPTSPRRCAAAGATFIGPPPAAIRAMGGKTSARALMQAAGVPVVPGDNGEGGRGFATAGRGEGGRGAHRLPGDAQGGGGRRRAAACAWSTARTSWRPRSRARSARPRRAFGDDTIYLEKAIVRPRHIEIQVFGDEHGGAVHLYERDCSIQRRNQKVIEESPSPAIDDETRARMGEVAVRAARSVGYVGAGTIEMLFDAAATQLLLPGDEHAPAGRAPDDGAGDGRRSGALAARGRAGRARCRWRRRRSRGAAPPSNAASTPRIR